MCCSHTFAYFLILYIYYFNKYDVIEEGEINGNIRIPFPSISHHLNLQMTDINWTFHLAICNFELGNFAAGIISGVETNAKLNDSGTELI